MTDMPNFWWCPTHHLYRGGIERPCAEAVKLGDVEALRADREHWYAEWEKAAHLHMAAERRRDSLRAEIRAVLDREGPNARAALRIAAIVEREPSSPQPDSETEWGWRAPWDDSYVTQRPEAEARRVVAQSAPGARVLVRREVGPWKVVSE